MSPLDSSPDSVFVSIRLIREISNSRLSPHDTLWFGCPWRYCPFASALAISDSLAMSPHLAFAMSLSCFIFMCFCLLFLFYFPEYDSTIDVSFPGWLIAVMVLSFIFVIGITVVLLVCRVYRQRALMSMANPYRAPQFSPYPTVQYQTTPQPAANVHPAVAGYQPPATGYGVPTSGYPTSQTVASQEQGFHRGYQPSNQISYAGTQVIPMNLQVQTRKYIY